MTDPTCKPVVRPAGFLARPGRTAPCFSCMAGG
jgi:hypothetical protein